MMTDRKHFTWLTIVLTSCLLMANLASAQVREAAVVTSAVNVLGEFVRIPNQGIPRSLLARAEGLVIIPRMIKVGFVAGVRRGMGIVVVRDERRAWKPPMFITMTGGSVGWQAGIQSTDVILVFMTRRSISGLLSGKFTIGADAAAAAGPVGRQAAAATDGRLQAEILSYSRSRGLFAGVSVDGSVLQVDASANQAYYRSAGMTPDGTPIVANAQLPPSAAQLLSQLAIYTASQVAAPSMPPAGTQILPGTEPTYTPPGVSAYDGANYPAPGQPIGTASPAAPSTNTNAGTAPLNLGPPPAVSPDDLETTRESLVDAAAKMGPLLDDQWRLYLALPKEVFAGGPAPPMDRLETVLDRFDRVGKDNRYSQLSQRREFQRLYQLLQTYRQQLRHAAAQSVASPQR